jgi:predicted Zn-dependent protease
VCYSAAVSLLLSLLLAWQTSSAQAPTSSPLAQVEAAMSAAERSLREGHPQETEQQYTEAIQRAKRLAGQSSGPVRADLVKLLAQAYFNTGIISAQAGRFAEAADRLELAAKAQPDFPRVQYSLGVARFNAKQYEKATGPLASALAQEPTNADVRRMLSLAWVNLEEFEKAADLLKDDPGRESDLSLQYLYGLSLVRSGRADVAESIFTGLLKSHGDSPELNVVLGQAHAERGDFDAAIPLLQRALQARPDVPDASAALGTIYFKQGRLTEAEAVLRAGLAARPDDMTARQTLAAALEQQGQRRRGGAAASRGRRGAATRGEFALPAREDSARRGHAREAVEQLVEATRLSPEDAATHFQLAQAYRQLGRTAQADEQLAVYRDLKDKQRGRRP